VAQVQLNFHKYTLFHHRKTRWELLYKISTMQVNGHIAESSSHYTKPKRHHTLSGAVSNATRAQMLLLKGLGMPIKQSP